MSGTGGKQVGSIEIFGFKLCQHEDTFAFKWLVLRVNFIDLWHQSFFRGRLGGPCAHFTATCEGIHSLMDVKRSFLSKRHRSMSKNLNSEIVLSFGGTQMHIRCIWDDYIESYTYIHNYIYIWDMYMQVYDTDLQSHMYIYIYMSYRSL